MKCNNCNGRGLIPLGDGIRGLKKCECCNGSGEVQNSDGRKHGVWDIHYVCSQCGEVVRTFKDECPVCHTIMDGKGMF